jgi:hypothetical protein
MGNTYLPVFFHLAVRVDTTLRQVFQRKKKNKRSISGREFPETKKIAH